MPTLSPGTVIRVSDGSSLTVVAYIASGGQGEVYRVRRQPGNIDMALKWYTNEDILGNRGFRQALADNCRHQSPSDTFLWPQAVTEHYNGSYGYIMKLRPEGYIDLGKFFCIDENPQAYFRSNMAKLTAAIQICDAFSKLHRSGFSYQDINDGSFLIDPRKGYVLICDNDNIVVDGHNTGIAGKPHYMAPEVADGNTPNTASDRFSLAIILYRLFMVDHPFEGRRTSTCTNTCLTPAHELRLFGRDAIFCHDTNDRSNSPVEGLHDNSIRYWPLLTPTLQRAFRVALSRQAICDPIYRIRASSWKDIMLAERAGLVTCQADPGDPVHDFLCEGSLPPRCPLCNERLGPSAWLVFENGQRPYRLTEHKPLFLGDSFTPVGVCRTIPSHGVATLALENASDRPWLLITPRGKTMPVLPATRCQLVDGMTLLMGSYKARVKF